MNNEINEMINAWFDGELDKKRETELFNLLATDDEARTAFRAMSNLRNALATIEEDVPDELDERIFRSIAPKQQSSAPARKWQLFPVLGYAFSVILVVITLLMMLEIRSYRNGLEDLNTKVKEQDQTIRMMFNAYPTIVVKPTQNEIIQ
ncbi:MAG: hypothetical protein HBSAPP04_02950 [Ignavibacteriaceae bacterium]|nr:MAG: hypothetical protein EDM75_03775 [Chlorobiota bacterium]GJQ31456.1 MAG: hypothetical protein HBSAPP04_02950 [Ignavibacteriaceae bacterium]